MNTAIGLRHVHSFTIAGALANDTAHFKELSNALMTKVMTGQSEEPSEDPDVIEGLTALKIMLARAERPNWVPCFVQSYQFGLIIMWQHYAALQKVLLKPLHEKEFRKTTLVAKSDAWSEVQYGASRLIQEHIQEAREFWEALKKFQESRETPQN
ncbi:hypothetical protein KEM56_002036 [Ascosphaera pollenicola]|nr:hypothetical protein KEM56_002036 [Ascosphaera pollenicola]